MLYHQHLTPPCDEHAPLPVASLCVPSSHSAPTRIRSGTMASDQVEWGLAVGNGVADGWGVRVMVGVIVGVGVWAGVVGAACWAMVTVGGGVMMVGATFTFGPQAPNTNASRSAIISFMVNWPHVRSHQALGVFTRPSGCAGLAKSGYIASIVLWTKAKDGHKSKLTTSKASSSSSGIDRTASIPPIRSI